MLFLLLWIILFLVGLFGVWALYMTYNSNAQLRKIIDINTGKPLPISASFISILIFILKFGYTDSTDTVTDYLLKLSSKYGDAYCGYTLFPTVTFTSPVDVKNLLKKMDEFPKQAQSSWFDHVKLIIGPNNLTSINNPLWHEHRNVLNKAFTNSSIFFNPMCKKVDSLIERWAKAPNDVKIGYDLQKLTLDVLATCIFGMEFDTLNGKLSEPLDAYNYAIERVFQPLRFLMPFLNKLPVGPNQRLNDSLTTFDKYCWDVMAQTKKNMQEKTSQPSTEKKEIISLIELMYENGTPEPVIRDNMSLFFLAGHETTSSNLSWIVSILASNPEVQEKARKEVFDKIPNEFTYESLKDLNYIEGLIKETLRLYPAVPIISNRIAAEDTTLGHVRIPKGTVIQGDLVTMSYDPKIWEDPKVVRPERWFNDVLTKEQRSTWMPFSIDPRICIGMNFSLVEQKIFLVDLLKRFKEIKLSPNAQIKSKKFGIVNSPVLDSLIVQFVPF